MEPSGRAGFVRALYEDGTLAERPAELLALLDPEVEYVNPADAIEPGTRSGFADVAKAFAFSLETFESTRYEVMEVFAAADVVVAWVHFHARGRGSDVEVVQPEAHTWSFRDGLIVRFEWGRDLDAALEAAGLKR
jgi:ketosteroid isomerase-like protein